MTFNFSNKYHAKKSYSQLCERTFDSKAECRRAEALKMLEKAGAISELKFQVPYQLCLKPNIKIRIDFQYIETSSGRLIHEDTKGQTSGSSYREFRVKTAWLQEKFGVQVFLTS